MISIKHSIPSDIGKASNIRNGWSQPGDSKIKTNNFVSTIQNMYFGEFLKNFIDLKKVFDKVDCQKRSKSIWMCFSKCDNHAKWCGVAEVDISHNFIDLKKAFENVECPKSSKPVWMYFSKSNCPNRYCEYVGMGIFHNFIDLKRAFDFIKWLKFPNFVKITICGSYSQV